MKSGQQEGTDLRKRDRTEGGERKQATWMVLHLTGLAEHAAHAALGAWEKHPVWELYMWKRFKIGLSIRKDTPNPPEK